MQELTKQVWEWKKETEEDCLTFSGAGDDCCVLNWWEKPVVGKSGWWFIWHTTWNAPHSPGMHVHIYRYGTYGKREAFKKLLINVVSSGGGADQSAQFNKRRSTNTGQSFSKTFSDPAVPFWRCKLAVPVCFCHNQIQCVQSLIGGHRHHPLSHELDNAVWSRKHCASSGHKPFYFLVECLWLVQWFVTWLFAIKVAIFSKWSAVKLNASLLFTV